MGDDNAGNERKNDERGKTDNEKNAKCVFSVIVPLQRLYDFC